MNLTVSRPCPMRAEDSAASERLGNTRTRRIARVLMELLIAAGRGTLMLAPVIVPPEDEP